MFSSYANAVSLLDMCEVRVRIIKKRKLEQLDDTSNESTSAEVPDVDKDEADAVVQKYSTLSVALQHLKLRHSVLCNQLGLV